MEFEFKRLSKELLLDLSLLFKLSGKNTSLQQIERKYDTKIFGAEYVGYLAYDHVKKIPIAFYGVIPVQACYNSQTILVAQSADTLTHPDFRKLGLFILLANKTYELCDELKIKYLFGIPNYNSFKGFVNKLDWENPANFDIYSKRIFTLPLNKLAHLSRITRTLFSWYVNFILTLTRLKSDIHPSVLSEQDFFYIPKNINYLSYKFSELHFKIRIENITFLISFNRFFKIGFYSQTEIRNIKKAIRKLQLLAFITGCHKMTFQILNNENADFFCDKELGFIKTVGLPYIVKPISDEYDNQFLKIDFFDFDTF